ncbi:hypothetical protein VaNZ11_003447 [Volvox africanus]|uniref:Uncharacterized protein n=1 Tax=Volvox africanus TaxID=51714 RepID=A0ABQ5RVS5_9CHLO|nr:hypothetical protein VaNZ11_003447 [Volvox africanus]
MVLELTVERSAGNGLCATPGIPLRPDADVVKVVSTCGGQRNDEASTTTVTTHDPAVFLSKLSIAQVASALPLSFTEHGKSNEAAGRAAAHSVNCQGSDSNGKPSPHVCAVSGVMLKPADVVLLLPPTAVAAPPGSPEVALTLAAGAQLLQPVLQAVGPETAAITVAGLPGLQQLDDQQRFQTINLLQEAAAAAATRADGMRETDSEGASSSHGIATATAAAVTAVAAVDAGVRCNDDEDHVPSAKRRRLVQQSQTVEGGGGEGQGPDRAMLVTARPRLPQHCSRRTTQGVSDVPPMPLDGGVKAQDCDGTKSPRVVINAGAASTHLESSETKKDDATTDQKAPGSSGGTSRAAKPAVFRATVSSNMDLDEERAAIMERNRQKLLELGLPGLIAGMVKQHSGGAVDTAPPRRPASQRGVGAKRSREGAHEPTPPRRMSLRQRGVAADTALAAGIDQETSAGVTLVAGRQAVEAAAAGQAEGGAEKARHPTGELPFRSENGNEGTDAAFLEALKAAAAAASETGSPSPVAASAQRRERLSDVEDFTKLSLVQRDVAKVTKDGVTHMAWLPGCERLLLAAADKAGRVSLWNVDAAESGPAEETDGVLMFSPHSEYISGMRWLGREAAIGPCRLISASYDGSFRALDLGGSGTWLELPAPGDPRDNEFSSLDVTADGRTAYLGDPCGNVDIVDLRAAPPPPRPRPLPRSSPSALSPPPLAATGTAAVAMSVDSSRGGDGVGGGSVGSEGGVKGPASSAHGVVVGGLQIRPKKINSLHLEPTTDVLLASSCSDGTVCIWDVRKLRTAVAAVAHTHKGSSPQCPRACKPLSELRHGKSCHAAYWAHDGSKRLLSTSFDDTLRVWSPSGGGGGGAGSGDDDGDSLALELSIPHNNQTGRWITPFRAVWSATCDAVLVGNMHRGLDVFRSTAPRGQRDGGGDGDVLRSPHLIHPHKAGSKESSKAAAKAGGDSGGGGPGQLLRTLVSEHMTAIPSRVACHPILPVVVAATSSGRCHVWR